MVTWFADGGVSGYDAATIAWKQEKFLLASDAMVDTEGITRLQYSNYPSPNGIHGYISAVARFNFSAADILNNPGKNLTATMFVVPASAFSGSAAPTRAQMQSSPSARIFRATGFFTTSGNKTVTVIGPPASSLSPGTKYWVMVMPTAVTNMASTPSVTNDPPLLGYSANTSARGLSLWTNRTAAKPTIAVSDRTPAAGDTITFTFVPHDPDDDSYVGTNPYALDLAGFQVQYAAKATVDNPTPSWSDLPVYFSSDGSGDVVGTAWFIDRTSHNNYSGMYGAWGSQSLPIVCGDSTSTPVSTGALPAGAWQLRCRTFDYGYPDPGPLNPLHGLTADFTPDTYPANQISPWSDSVSVTIPTETPPPIPLSPRDNIAVSEDTDVSLRWRYRNTAAPPSPQEASKIQIRPVGDDDWTTLQEFVDLDYPTPSPDSLDLIAGGPSTALRTWGFENAGLGTDGWVAPVGGTSVTRVTTEAHSGTASLQIEYIGGCALGSAVTAGTCYQFEFWVKNPDLVDVQFALQWYDVSNVLIKAVYVVSEMNPSPASGDWYFVSGFAVAPPLATQVDLFIATTVGNFIYVDDIAFAESSPYSLDESTQYEWRVQTVSFSSDPEALSDFSEIVRFWIVPAPASGDVRPVPTETVEGATLGCGKHRAFVYRRGGQTRVGEITDISYLDWGRTRDDISTSKIVVSGWNLDCGNLLASLQTWAYEIVIFRDNGFSVDRVWEGPITLLTYEMDSVTIHAKDVMGYAYRRIIKQEMNDAGTGNGDTVVNRATRVLQNTFAPDDPNVLAYLTVIANEDDSMEYRSTPAYSRTAFEEVDDMAANAGLDYTTVGRAILLWGTRYRIGTLPEFRDKDFGASPIVSEYGMSMANRYAISDGNGIYGEATRLDANGEDSIYGLVEMLSSSWASDSPSDTGTYTAAGLQTIIESFEGYAERSIENRYPPPVIVRIPDNTSLNPSAVISIQQLVPGVVVPIRSTGTLRTVVGNQKLDSVKVVETSGDETISITLSPFNREDTSTETTDA